MIAGDGTYGVSLDVHSLVLDDNGSVDEAHESINASSTGDLTTVGINEGNPLAANLVGYLVYRHEFELDPGEYKINVAVIDNVTGRVGATTVEVDVMEPHAGWSTSDPVLVSIEATGRPQPVVHGRVLPGQDIGALIEVYDGQQPILSGIVIRDNADDTDSQQGARIFPIPMRRVGAALHRGTIPLPGGMPPGRYVVHNDEDWSESGTLVVPAVWAAPEREGIELDIELERGVVR